MESNGPRTVRRSPLKGMSSQEARAALPARAWGWGWGVGTTAGGRGTAGLASPQPGTLFPPSATPREKRKPASKGEPNTDPWQACGGRMREGKDADQQGRRPEQSNTPAEGKTPGEKRSRKGTRNGRHGQGKGERARQKASQKEGDPGNDLVQTTHPMLLGRAHVFLQKGNRPTPLVGRSIAAAAAANHMDMPQRPSDRMP